MNKKINIILLSFFSINVLGQEMETDRPDQTEASSTVLVGSIQIESGMAVESMRNDFGSESSSYTIPSTLFRVALMDHFEFRLVNTLRLNKSDDSRNLGIDDLEVGFKWQWTDGDGWKPQMALMSHIVIPTAINNSKTYGMVNKVLISHDISDRFALGYNLGHIYYGSNRGDFVYSLALGISINDKVGFYIENYGSIIEFEKLNTNMDAGFTFLIKENIQLDYSFGIGVTDRMNYQALGISFRLN